MPRKKTNIESASAPTAVPATPAPVHRQSTESQKVQSSGGPCPPPVDLDAALRWRSASTAQQQVLQNLQGNILKGHGRDQTMNLFVRFGSEAVQTRRVLRWLGHFHVTSAYRQLVTTQTFKEQQVDAGTFGALFISATGYQALGVPLPGAPNNEAFAPGMKAQASLDDLKDKLADWDPGFREQIDAMVLIADDDTRRLSEAAVGIERRLVDAGCTIVVKQAGKMVRNDDGNGLEHFGYVDGRSQPLMLQEDIDAESREEGIVGWDPTAGLSRALVLDAAAGDCLSFGSYFVFRKLEQHVRAFKRQEQKLADALGLVGADQRELAGALLVGRFEDGTPVTLSDEARGLKRPHNDFNYDADAQGGRCPFHAHIRKTNPRGSHSAEAPEAERAHIMARRGIPYEDVPRQVHPGAVPAATDETDFEANVAPLLPEGKVGLLFMAYNAELDNQFVFTQKNWANDTGFPKVTGHAQQPPGLDGLIGQPPSTADTHLYADRWDAPTALPRRFDGFNGFVTMRGGEYFFTPSLTFLRKL